MKAQYQTFQTRYSFFSGARSCGDINFLKFLFKFFENFKKRPGRLGLTSWKQKSFDMVKTNFFDTHCCEKINSSCL